MLKPSSLTRATLSDMNAKSSGKRRAASMSERVYQTYQEFFPFYLREHSKPLTRNFHYVAATAGATALLWALIAGPWWVIFYGPLIGYGSAWISHAFIEKNRPATFTYPLWSFMGDYHMTWLAISGKLPDALRQAGITVDGEPIAEAAE
jgi:hypothetical protein